jgi:hypothetical protein
MERGTWRVVLPGLGGGQNTQESLDEDPVS